MEDGTIRSSAPWGTPTDGYTWLPVSPEFHLAGRPYYVPPAVERDRRGLAGAFLPTTKWGYRLTVETRLCGPRLFSALNTLMERHRWIHTNFVILSHNDRPDWSWLTFKCDARVGAQVFEGILGVVASEEL